MLSFVFPERLLLVALGLCLTLECAQAGEINQTSSLPRADQSRVSRQAISASASLPELSVAARKKEAIWDPHICVGCGGTPGVRVPTFR